MARARLWRPSLSLAVGFILVAWMVWLATFLARHEREIAEILDLEPAISPEGSLFGFSEYVAALALLLVIWSTSDFKYRFRLQVTTLDAQRIAFAASLAIGFLILLIDAWFHNHFPIPAALNESNNLRLALAVLFFALLSYLNYLAFIAPPRFSRLNARHAFQAMHHYIARGNPEQLMVVADWIGASAGRIVALAARRTARNSSRGGSQAVGSKDYAAYTLSLLGSRKLCAQMIDKSPWSVAELFRAAARYSAYQLPMSQFASNIGSELVANPQSALYGEDDGATSGLLGYTKPITTTIYGNYELVEVLASQGGSPLDLNVELSLALTAPQLEAYARAVLIFSEAYFSQRYPHHSYAFVRALHQFESATGSLGRLSSLGDDYWKADEYERLRVAIRFTRDAIKLLGKHPTPKKQRKREYDLDGLAGIHYRIAKLIFEFISHASYVSNPVWTCWNVQHNTVWADLFDFDNSGSAQLIKYYVRRLLYDEIGRMNSMPNFVTVRIIGYCLNVLGVSEEQANRSKRHEFDPVRTIAIRWAKHNYLRLVREYPALAEACLMGGISFEANEKRLIKTYSSMLGREPRRSYLRLIDS